MSLRFRYKLYQSNSPIIPLGGRYVRPRPVTFVTLIGPHGAWVEKALLDSGSDDSVFLDTVAARIGLDLSQAPSGMATSVGSSPIPVRYADLTLRLTDGKEFREWQATVGFTSVPLRHQLLGFAGCLQYFTSTFYGHLEEVELTVNPLYPGR